MPGTLAKRLDQIPVPPDLLDLVEVDQRLDGFALDVVVRERPAVRAAGDRCGTSS